MNWIHNMCSEITLLKSLPHLPGANEFSCDQLRLYSPLPVTDKINLLKGMKLLWLYTRANHPDFVKPLPLYLPLFFAGNLVSEIPHGKSRVRDDTIQVTLILKLPKKANVLGSIWVSSMDHETAVVGIHSATCTFSNSCPDDNRCLWENPWIG